MTITLEPPTDVATEPDVTDVDEFVEDEEPAQAFDQVVRIAVAVCFPLVGAGVMVGGIFSGVTPRLYACVGGLLGLLLAVVLERVQKPAVLFPGLILGLFAIGLICLAPTGVGNIFSVSHLVREAAANGKVLRPPVPFSPGWAALIGWLLGIMGFAAGWTAVVVRRPPIALILPLPVAAIAAISVPKSAQVVSGIVVLALFAVGLGLLSGAQAFGSEDQRPSLGYEVRRALRSVPVVGAITIALYFMAQAHFLFPQPVINPTEKPQKPHTVPLSAVKDRDLFDVSGTQTTGPWFLGSLDVYDTKTGDWDLAPVAQSKLAPIPSDGIVNPELVPGIAATFTIRGLTGAVLPGLPNPYGIVAQGPKLAYDSRTGNIRTAEGQVTPGLTFRVVAAKLPTVQDLIHDTAVIPQQYQQFTDIPSPPPAVTALMQQAPKGSKWQEWDFLRQWILHNVTATGAGSPVAVPVTRVQDMIAGSKKGSPFEIVAAQAMLARWVGIPARIGYGFDGGTKVGGVLQVHPANGATFVQVYFAQHGWLAVMGTPEHAQADLGHKNQQQTNPNVKPSNDISVSLYLPTVTPAPSVLLKEILLDAAIVVPTILGLVLLYFLYPAMYKAWVRGRRRQQALLAGPRARIALAYAEWRDYATDFGYGYQAETPLLFLERFVDDDEHTEFAWLVTRALWGDLNDELTDELAATAEELSRTLRRRLAAAQPATLRYVAAVSRLSLRHPYAPETRLPRVRRRFLREKPHAAIASS